MTTETITTCICGRHAVGFGVDRRKAEPIWLCKECGLLAEQIGRIRRFEPYELKALEGGVDAVGEFIDSIGGKTELSEYDELEQRMLVKAAVQGFGDRLRQLLRDGEAPW